jgi:hypothetical protein
MSAQIIEREGKPEYAVLPYHEYVQLMELAESVRDARDAREAMRELDCGEDEAIPANIVGRLIAGDDHPLKICLSQSAEGAGESSAGEYG